MPVSPACWEYSHSRMASASRSDSGIVSTRKAVFSAHLGKELGSRGGAPRSDVLIAPPDAFDGLPIIGAFPFEIRTQGVIKRVGHTLAVPLGMVVGLRVSAALRPERVACPKPRWLSRCPTRTLGPRPDAPTLALRERR